MTKIYILIPIYNDWESVSELIKEINFCIKDIEAEFSIIVINDASTPSPEVPLIKPKDVNNLAIIIFFYQKMYIVEV